MGRNKRAKELPAPKNNAMVASAARISGGRKVKNYSRSGQDSAWQSQCYDFYHNIGEFRFACDWVGAMISKAVLHAQKNILGLGGVEVVSEGTAAMSVDELFGSDDDRSEALRMIGIHFTIAGECFIVAYDSDDPDDPGVIWNVVAPTQYSFTADTHYVNNEKIEVENSDDVLVIRLWKPDPFDSRRAMSPSRAVMSILGEIARLTDHVAAQVDSRLAGAGILLMPSEMTFPTPPELTDEEGNPVTPTHVANDAESLMEVIQDTMAASIEDRSNASALVPIVITAPSDAISAVKHMTFWTELDAHAIELRSEAIRRLALGMDMPPEVLQGAAEANHWSAWQADEAAIKSHTEPLLKIITTSLTKGYLRPNLRTRGMEDFAEYSIGVDTSEMRLRPNRSKEALELYNLGELSGAALLRETGFDAADAMKDDERAQWFIRKVASGSTTPELVEAALKALGVKLDVAPAEESEDTQEARPTPSLADHPVRDIPNREVSERRKMLRDTPEGMVAAADQLVYRALERAGNRIKNKMQLASNTGTAAVDLYRVIPDGSVQARDVLTDAWAHVDRVANRYGVDTMKLTALLDQYTQVVVQSRTPHSYDDLREILIAAHKDGQLDMEATA